MRKGAIIGAILGFLVTRGKFFGAILGFIIGSAIENFIKYSSKTEGNGNSQYRTRSYNYDSGYYTQQIKQNDFISALLVLSGSVMKADGKILKAELDYVKQFFKHQFQLSDIELRQYMLKFKNILNKEFNVQQVCSTIKMVMPLHQRSLLIQYLFGIAKSDGHVSKQEADIIQSIAGFMGLTSAEFNQLKSMFYKDVTNAYKVLGIEDTANKEEIKKAYRKMAVKHHPDKFNKLGKEHQKAAKEKFQKIQDAYETIKKEKGFI